MQKGKRDEEGLMSTEVEGKQRLLVIGTLIGMVCTLPYSLGYTLGLIDLQYLLEEVINIGIVVYLLSYLRYGTSFFKNW